MFQYSRKIFKQKDFSCEKFKTQLLAKSTNLILLYLLKYYL